MAMNILFLGQLVNGEPQQLTYANSLDFLLTMKMNLMVIQQRTDLLL